MLSTSSRTQFLFSILMVIVPFSMFMTDTIQAQDHGDWETVMEEFEALDKQNNYPPESIFFTGSSSIRLWSSLAEDIAPYPVIERGFGGSRMPDLLHYADRYISDHSFRALVLFVANDITGNTETDRTPEEVQNLFEQFIQKIRGYNSDAPIFIIEITPTNSRWNVWSKTERANNLIAQLCDTHKNVMFIPTRDLFLTQEGTPNDDLFISDRLHLNEKGYAVWSKRIRSYLDPVLSTQ